MFLKNPLQCANACMMRAMPVEEIIPKTCAPLWPLIVSKNETKTWSTVMTAPIQHASTQHVPNGSLHGLGRACPNRGWDQTTSGGYLWGVYRQHERPQGKSRNEKNACYQCCKVDRFTSQNIDRPSEKKIGTKSCLPDIPVLELFQLGRLMVESFALPGVKSQNV